MKHMSRLLLIACCLWPAVGPSAAQTVPVQPVFKCGSGSRVTYTHVPCNGGKQVGKQAAERRVSKTFTPVPQDRAKKMARAQLPPETREKCVALETEILETETRLKAKVEPPTAAEEGELALQQLRYREMRC